MVQKSKDCTELWVGLNCTCEKGHTEGGISWEPHPPNPGYATACVFLYFIAYHSMCTYQCCHVQCCGHGPLFGLSDQTLVCHCKPSEHM
jgi:hypothetical protein